MRLNVSAMLTALLLSASVAQAHRLDEYLQAVTIAVGHDRMRAQIRLTPGVAVYPIVLRSIDTDGDGAISPGEQTAYASRVLQDLSFALDGTPLPIHFVSSTFAAVGALKEGRGDIVIDFDAALPAGASSRKLILENRHQRQLSVYLVNALVPTDTSIRIAEQIRSTEQSYYRLDFENAAAPRPVAFHAQLLFTNSIITISALLALASLIAFARRNARAIASVQIQEPLD